MLYMYMVMYIVSNLVVHGILLGPTLHEQCTRYVTVHVRCIHIQTYCNIYMYMYMYSTSLHIYVRQVTASA